MVFLIVLSFAKKKSRELGSPLVHPDWHYDGATKHKTFHKQQQHGLGSILKYLIAKGWWAWRING